MPPLPAEDEDEEPEEVRAELPLLQGLLERVLGPEGSTLIDLCRSCGSSVALRPVLRDDGDDEFVLEVLGTAAAVEATEARFAELIGEGDGGQAALEDLQVGEDPQVQEIEFPSSIRNFVLGTRTPGCKGMGKAEAMPELQRITGVTELTLVKTDDPETTLLRAVGEPAALSQLTELVEERRAACQGMLEEMMEVPMHALGMFFSNDWKLAYEVENKSGAMMGIKGPKDKERQTAHIGLRGMFEQIELAKQLILERLHNKKNGRGSKGKGKSGGSKGSKGSKGNKGGIYMQS